MNATRTTAFALLVLDVITAFIVFDVVVYFRGLNTAGHIIFHPWEGPAAAIVFSLYLIEGYKTRTDMLSLDYTSLHAIALIGTMLATLMFVYVFSHEGNELQASRMVIIISFLALIPLTLGYRRMIYPLILKGQGERNLVFFGDRSSCEAFREECRKMGMEQRVLFTVVSEESVAPFGPVGDDRLRPFQAVLDDVQHGRINVEAIVLRESARELLPEISRRLVELYFSGVPTYTLELFHQVYWQKIPLYRLNQTWLFQEGFQIAREPVFERLKRVSDIVFAIVGLLLAAPLILFAAFAIWIDDRGPVFFLQTRVGKNHTPFRLVKLRTMRPGEARGISIPSLAIHESHASANFRTSRLDELPQLWNVLRGEMSLIGPRAEWDRLVKNYEEEIPCYHFRHLVKPGVTGWAQVNYTYGANLEDTLRKLEYDLYYIRHFSFMLDASIVLKTIHVMLFGKGR